MQQTWMSKKTHRGNYHNERIALTMNNSINYNDVSMIWQWSLIVYSYIINQILLSSLPSVILVSTFQATTMGLVCSRYLSLASRCDSL